MKCLLKQITCLKKYKTIFIFTCLILLSFKLCAVSCAVSLEALQTSIKKSQDHLLKLQHTDGHWEGKIHINPRETAYYILTTKYIGIADKTHLDNSVKWLVTHQHSDGSWGFFDEGGEGDISITGIVTLALEAAGVKKDSSTLKKAWMYINTHGGIDAFDIFCKIFYVLYNKMSWDNKNIFLPPIEIMLLDKDSDKSLYQMNAWLREATVPMMVLKTLDKKNLTASEQAALKEAEFFIASHQLEDGCWYTQLPTSLCMIVLYRLNWQKHKPRIMVALDWLHKKQNPDGYQRRFELSIWDTALSIVALIESGASPVARPLLRSGEWLINSQTVAGGHRWSDNASGGWSYNPFNIIYPDNDDTSLALMALTRISMKSYTGEYKKKVAMERGKRWLLYMQNDDGGWATFTKNQGEKKYKVAPIAIADTSIPDITGHVLSALGKLGYTAESTPIKRAIEYLKKDQTDHGAWYGRWGLCYLYGTSTVLIGLKDVKEDISQFYIQKALHWLKKNQNNDGGWGEEYSQWCERQGISFTKISKSTVEQTAWVIMALLAAGESANSEIITKGVNFLLKQQRQDGSWRTKNYTVLGLNPYRNTLYPDYWSLMALGIYCQAKYQPARIKNSDINSLYWPTNLDTYNMVNKKIPLSLHEELKEVILEAKGNAEIDLSLVITPTTKPLRQINKIIISNIGTAEAKKITLNISSLNVNRNIGDLAPGASFSIPLPLKNIIKQAIPSKLQVRLTYFDLDNKESIVQRILKLPLLPLPLQSNNLIIRSLIGLLLIIIILVIIIKFQRKKSFLLKQNYALFRLAMNNLRQHKIRTALSMLGMIVGIATLAGTISLGLSFKNKLSKDFESFGAGRILVLPYKLQIQAGPPKEILGDKPSAKFSQKDIEVIQNIKNIHSVCPIINSEETMQFGDKKIKSYVVFADPEKFKLTTPMSLAEGRFFTIEERYKVILGHSIAHKAFSKKIKIGDKLKIGQKIFSTVGIFKDTGGIPGRIETLIAPNILIYLPLRVANEFLNQSYYDGLEVKVIDKNLINQTSKKIEKVLGKQHIDEAFSTIYSKKLQNKVAALLSQFNIIIIIISIFALLVSGIGIMNIMLVSVTERKKEIGILKAIGAKENTIVKLFLFEAITIGSISGLLGCILGYFILKILQTIANINAPCNPFILLILSFGFAVAVCISAGTYPAYLASKLEPVEAIRNE